MYDILIGFTFLYLSFYHSPLTKDHMLYLEERLYNILEIVKIRIKKEYYFIKLIIT